MRNLRVLILGTLFGIILVKGQLVSWDNIYAMFRFESPYMYLVIGSAVAVGARIAADHQAPAGENN